MCSSIIVLWLGRVAIGLMKAVVGNAKGERIIVLRLSPLAYWTQPSNYVFFAVGYCNERGQERSHVKMTELQLVGDDSSAALRHLRLTSGQTFQTASAYDIDVASALILTCLWTWPPYSDDCCLPIRSWCRTIRSAWSALDPPRCPPLLPLPHLILGHQKSPVPVPPSSFLHTSTISSSHIIERNSSSDN